MRNGEPVTSDSAQALRNTCPPPSPSEPLMIIMVCPGVTARRASPLHAHHLLQRVNDLNEVGLRRHDRVDRLVGARAFVDHPFVLAACDARSIGDMIVEAYLLTSRRARHHAP